MAFTPFSAKAAKVRLAGSVWTAKSWTVSPRTDKIDVTNFEGGGFGQAIGGIIEADITIDDTDWDSGTNGPYDNPPNLQPAQVIAANLYLSSRGAALGGPNWSFPNALVLEASNSARVRESVKIPSVKLYSGSVPNGGSFSFPTAPGGFAP